MGLCCFDGAFRSVSGSASFRLPLPLDLPPRSVAEDFAAVFIYCDRKGKFAVLNVASRNKRERQSTSPQRLGLLGMMTFDCLERDLSPNVISTCLASLSRKSVQLLRFVSCSELPLHLNPIAVFYPRQRAPPSTSTVIPAIPSRINPHLVLLIRPNHQPLHRTTIFCAY